MPLFGKNQKKRSTISTASNGLMAFIKCPSVLMCIYVCVCECVCVVCTLFREYNHEFSPIENPRTVMGIPLRLALFYIFHGVMGLFFHDFGFMDYI